MSPRRLLCTGSGGKSIDVQPASRLQTRGGHHRERRRMSTFGSFDAPVSVRCWRKAVVPRIRLTVREGRIQDDQVPSFEGFASY